MIGHLFECQNRIFVVICFIFEELLEFFLGVAMIKVKVRRFVLNEGISVTLGRIDGSGSVSGNTVARAYW